MASIHPTAFVDPSAKLGQSVTVGPFASVGADAVIGEDTWIGPHVIIDDKTVIGSGNFIQAAAVLGTAPQDKKASQEETLLTIGDHNTIREHVTIHRGTLHGGGLTQVGSHGYFGPFSHIAHDCFVSDRVQLGPMTGISGHVTIGEGAVAGAHVGVHQFVRLGPWSRSADYAGVSKDVPPYCEATGNPADAIHYREDLDAGANLGPEEIEVLLKAVAILGQVIPMPEILRQLSELPETPSLKVFVSFLSEETHRYPDRRRGVIRRLRAAETGSSPG